MEWSGTKIQKNIGEWRSLVAHLTGGQVAAGSNPVSPTIRKSLEFQAFRGFFFLTEIHNIIDLDCSSLFFVLSEDHNGQNYFYKKRSIREHIKIIIIVNLNMMLYN